MIRSIALIELNSIARGIAVADVMLKSAEVRLLFSKPTCPGKFIILVAGEVGAVKAAQKSGVDYGGQYVVDDVLIANVHPDVIGAINCNATIDKVNALGILEFFSIAASIVAADAAAKAAQVKLIEIRLGMGIGGKSYITLTGDVSSVKAAVEVGANAVAQTGMLLNKEVIPSPRKEVFNNLL
ncbi:BMC domain-containing protein [Clostridium estertheticum]|uniref:BMC domain-containing protein n=1 Tax=Clostridium estertheticum TaxID=238834 RepID=UPI001CF1442C|nr:BMC domain-containing protein [Clostridium estertheticum]MCB2352709.1 BMC domain-containing protein [Clostridium estertheticum]WAG40018.1 BMC domain-containing protein [Clostridium estertheticum]